MKKIIAFGWESLHSIITCDIKFDSGIVNQAININIKDGTTKIFLDKKNRYLTLSGLQVEKIYSKPRKTSESIYIEWLTNKKKHIRLLGTISNITGTKPNYIRADAWIAEANSIYQKVKENERLKKPMQKSSEVINGLQTAK